MCMLSTTIILVPFCQFYFRFTILMNRTHIYISFIRTIRVYVWVWIGWESCQMDNVIVVLVWELSTAGKGKRKILPYHTLFRKPSLKNRWMLHKLPSRILTSSSFFFSLHTFYFYLIFLVHLNHQSHHLHSIQ